MSVFPARYAGRCAYCDVRIHIGDPIRMTDDGPIHDGCDVMSPPEPRDNPVCPCCWLTHPEGACDR